MPRFLRRMLFAIFLSSASFAATEYWFKNHQPVIVGIGKKDPIAILSEKNLDVQRKPIGRVIWESLSQEDSLYTGEAIRTTQDAEATIRFVKTGTTLSLEPNTLVVLEQNESGIALDFIQGNVFVQSEKSANPTEQKITLKSGNSQIDLANTDLSLATTTDGKVDLAVFKGSAQITQNGQSQTLEQDTSGLLGQSGLSETKVGIKVVVPLPGKAVFIEPEQKIAKFKWQPISKNENVFFEWGSDQKILRRWATPASGEVGEISVPFKKVGRIYWRLIAVNKTTQQATLESRLMSAKVVAKVPPQLLEPQHLAQVFGKTSGKSEVQFRWTNPLGISSLVVEIAKDKSLKDTFKTANLTQKNNVLSVPMNEPGKYFWRVTGYLNSEGENVHVSSRINEFTFTLGANNVPPKIRSPINQQTLAYSQVVREGVYFSWDPVGGIEKYKLILQKMNASTPPGIEKETEVIVHTSPYKTGDLGPGKYRWLMRSLDESDQPSEASAHAEFSIDEMARLAWMDGSAPSTYEYVTAHPTLYGEWQTTNDKNVSWRYRFKQKDSAADISDWVYTNKNSIQQSVPKDGAYEIELESVNGKKQTLARSDLKIISVQPKPLLPAPQFDQLPEVVKADRKGDLLIQWQPVNGAKEYVLKVLNPSGQMVREQKVQRSTASVQKLKPGPYEVKVNAIDQHDRTGNESDVKKVEVPNSSNIEAPKLRGVQVR